MGEQHGDKWAFIENDGKVPKFYKYQDTSQFINDGMWYYESDDIVSNLNSELCSVLLSESQKLLLLRGPAGPQWIKLCLIYSSMKIKATFWI
ncbi:Hypothetical protein HVR_LOCUS902 [uncultured virus]|nr:Hypothetical protein HVR_LOCUS902 [uncultured virus]